MRAVAGDKERLSTERLREHGVEAHQGTVPLVRALRGRRALCRAPAPPGTPVSC